MHILNYNSPGATGALPMGAAIVNDLLSIGIIQNDSNVKEREKNQFGILRKYQMK